METATKVKLGFGALATIGLAGAVIASGKIIGKVQHASNRHKVKQFVTDKFDGSEKLLDIVDKLSDDDLDNIMKILGKIKDGKKHITVSGSSIKDATDDLKEKLLNLVEQVI
ncbi:hypothetical protein [Enterococcus sp. CSURQ0835]|uniref:hypothetical protein n=1 Tax=Enterococcus sp. CSURQ0835 TaxID=2681394 RepID=UPI0013595962|nr:hypothetical protein [Enterococcus sp. CSURQ0835]